MGGACSAHGSVKKYVQNFSGETLRDHVEDLGVDGKIILERILGK
jgi:hypothetical protein